jgi:plasmid maintenance system antidote protein VapI
MKLNFYDAVGKHIQEWVKTSHLKTQKKLAQRLELSEYQLSRMITGAQPMPGHIITKLTEHLGFSSKYFSDYFTLQNDNNIPENLTKEDLIKMILSYQIIVNDAKEMYTWSWNKVERIMGDNKDIIKSSVALLKENENLREKIKKITKELEDLKRTAMQ